MTVSLITGINGQDGSFLAELLVEKGHEVHGILRRASTINTWRIEHLENQGAITGWFGDLTDTNSIIRLLMKIKPDEIYNIGSQSHVRVSFDIPEYTAQVTGLAPIRILESMRSLGMEKTKYYQASSSEMFGISPAPQNENTPFQPQSPYGIAKLYGFWTTKSYRTGYKMFACNGILFNHESERRGETFVTKKIVRAAVKIKLGKQKQLKLGNLEARRDWGHARDYCEAIYLIMHHTVPDDFVVATGENHTVREFAEEVFKHLKLNFYDYMVYDDVYTRPNEVPELLGDSTKIRNVLGWKPKVGFHELIDIMIKSVWDEESKGHYGGR
jgi:GDPmannose 4,6-dehydratase